MIINPHKGHGQSIGGDPFYGKVIGMVEASLKQLGYYMMLYSSSDIEDARMP